MQTTTNTVEDIPPVTQEKRVKAIIATLFAISDRLNWIDTAACLSSSPTTRQRAIDRLKFNVGKLKEIIEEDLPCIIAGYVPDKFKDELEIYREQIYHNQLTRQEQRTLKTISTPFQALMQVSDLTIYLDDDDDLGYSLDGEEVDIWKKFKKENALFCNVLKCLPNDDPICSFTLRQLIWFKLYLEGYGCHRISKITNIPIYTIEYFVTRILYPKLQVKTREEAQIVWQQKIQQIVGAK